MGLVQALKYEVPQPNAAQRALWHVSSSSPGAWLFAKSGPPVDTFLLRLSKGQVTLAKVVAGLPGGSRTGRSISCFSACKLLQPAARKGLVNRRRESALRSGLCFHGQRPVHPHAYWRPIWWPAHGHLYRPRCNNPLRVWRSGFLPRRWGRLYDHRRQRSKERE
jgi:hypothetical protein